MKLYLVTSINRQGFTLTTRHYSPLGVAAEQLRRSLAGHVGISVQEGPLPVDPEPVRPRVVKPRPQRPGGGA